MKSSRALLHFGDFTLDPANRLLTRAGVPVDLGGRYLDALVLLASEPGQLISKHRLHDEVWRGVPVTDEALSQAIMALRRALGDEAGKPRFIETVPRHGYRFVAAVSAHQSAMAIEQRADAAATRTTGLIVGGVLGATAAGVAIGLTYGVLLASYGAGSAISLVLVLIGVSALAALVSGAGIASGIGLLGSARRSDWWRPIAGGAVGGLVLGGFARLLGLDALQLLTGQVPKAIAGGGEGLAIGLAVGAAVALTRRKTRSWSLATSAVLGSLAGGLAVALGGTLMAGSLAALIKSYPSATIPQTIAPRGVWMVMTGAFEGALFTTGLVAGLRTAALRAAR